jgi:DNA-binding transcriptional LysR family regulator
VHIPWNDVELVIAIADAGSLSGAARTLRTTQPTVSRRLAELEAELGEPLFVRAVDGTTPTSLGERMLEPARRMAECAVDVGHAVADVERGPRGVVRISAAPGMAYAFLAPFAGYLRSKLPEILLEVASTVRYVDLVRREADLAIRWQTTSRRGTPRDLEVLAAVEHPIGAYATAAYIATRRRGYGIADVDWIGWSPPFDQLPPNPQLAAMIPGFRPAFASDDFMIQLRAAQSGVGAIILPSLRYRLEPTDPLIEMKLELRVPPAKTHLLAARGSLAVPRIAAVAEHLVHELTGTVRRSKHP